MKMINILAIGNSFSQDATHYLQQIAATDGIELMVANLYIGGCSLMTHYNNIIDNKADYLLEINGSSTDKYISVNDALAMEKWDFIITQQASHDSGIQATYEPYLGSIISYVKDKCPDAEILLHETWAYEIDSLHPAFVNYDYSQTKMYECLKKAYYNEAEKYNLRVIPSGDVIQKLRSVEPFKYGYGGMSICRDGFHMNIIYGRYLLGAVWYKALTGKTVANNTYIPKTPLAPGAVCSESILEIIKRIVDENV